MANLLSNTTIGGYQSIHTGNIGSYAITSLSGYATQSWVQSQAYITSSNNYYYVNPGNGYGLGFWGQVPTTYGITMANENAGYGVIYGLSEYHLYFSMTGGGNRGFIFRNDSYGAVTQIGGPGWQMWKGELYPGYNNSSSGSQTSYYIYGNTNNAGLRTNGNWLVNGNLYIGSRDVWFTDWFNQGVRTDSNPNFASIYLNGTQLTGTQTSQLKTTLGVTGLPYTCDIYVEGDADTFYPVHFMYGDQDVWRRIIIKRAYYETAPWDPIGTGAHHGGLLLDWEGNFGGWGGAEYSDRLRVFNEQYTNVCADMYIYTHSMGYVFMLRGGHAIYHIFSDQPIRGYYQEGTPDIAYNTSTKFYNGGPSYPQYDVYAPAPLSLAQVNSSRIDGLRTKKQSLLDNRYVRQGVDISGVTNISSTNFLASNAFYLNGTSYYLNSTNGGIYTNARFETAGNLVVGGNSYLGNGNGDEVHINDILRVGATDSGDAHFFFGEGSSAGSDYGSHWYWDSAYTFTWNTRNAGTDTALFDYVTNDTTYVNWRRNFHMQDRAINYTGQLHFSYGTRFEANTSNYLTFKTDSTGYGAIQVRDGNSAVRGYSGYFDSGGFGLLNSSGNWGIRLNPGNAETLLYYAGNERLRTDNSGAYVTGRLDVSSYVYTPGAIIASNIQGGYQVLSLDTIKNPGLYQYDGGIGGAQPLGVEWSNVKTIEIGSSSRYSQFVMPYSNSRIFYRIHLNDAWQSYVELITSGNIGSQSVSYASTAGSASSANTALTVTAQSTISKAAHTAGASDYHLQLYSSDQGDSSKEISIRFHQGNVYWAQLRYRSGGFRFTGGGDDSLVPIYADTFYTASGNSSQWQTAYGWGNHASAGYLSTGGGTMSGSIAMGGNNITNVNQLQHSNGRVILSGNLHIDAFNGYAIYLQYYNQGVTTRIYGDIDMNNYNTTNVNIGYANNSFRAPIFYDSQDTNYYLDPNASLSLKISGNIDLIARSASWAEGIRVRVPSTSTWGGIRFTRDRGNDDGNWAIGFTGIDSTDDLTFWANNSGDGGAMRFRMTKDGHVTAQSSLRAPIFYDSNDTNYYGDFASTSVMNAIRFGTSSNNGTLSGAGDWGMRLTTDVGYIQFGPANSSYAHIYTDRPTFYFNRDLLVNGNSVITSATIGSQSVTYAINSTRLYASDSPYTYSGTNPYYMYMNYDGGSYWELKVSPATPGAVRVAYSNVSGSANSVAWTNVSSRPTALSQFTNDLGNYGGWLTTSGKAADSELLDGVDSAYFVRGTGGSAFGKRTTAMGGDSTQGLSSGFYDGSGMSNMPTSDWYHLIVNAHQNSYTGNQYEFQLATAFWDKSNFYVRSISPGDVGPWRTLVHNGNIGSQSVSYANSAGSASTAGSATMASQLSKYGDIYGDNWNTYYVSGKLIASAVLGMTGPNKPPTSYDYGVALSYGETGGPLMQWYFPENSANGTTIFKKGVYRTGWNGNWSSWKTLVEQEGDLCAIVGGAGTGLEVQANVGYNQNPLTYFLLRGQADTSWKSFKVRLTGDAGGQDIEFRRIAENGADERMFWVPRVANQVIFDYFFVQASDERKKDNITIISNPIEKVKQLRGAEFDWNSGVNEGTHDVGLIAQDVEAVLPEAVTTQEDGYKNLAYNKVIPLLVEAMKEQQTMIEALKAEIELLKNR